MSYYGRGKKERQLVEWSGCFWTLVITGVIGAIVYFFFMPFVQVAIDFSQIISGIY